MTNLHIVNKQELLKELQSRIQTQEISEEEISHLLEKEVGKKGYQAAAKDTKRGQEAQEGEIAQMSDGTKNHNESKKS